MIKAKKSSYTAKTCIAELEQIGVNFKKVTKGYRTELRNTLQRAALVLDRLHKNQTMKKDFRNIVMKERKKNALRNDKHFNLALEVVAKATGAVGRANRQIASKRALIIDYLRDLQTPVKKTAETIKTMGGVGKVYQKRLKEQEKAEKAEEARKVGEVRTAGKADTYNNERLNQGRDKSRSNDRNILTPILIALSDRDRILETEIGTKVVITGTVISSGSIKATSVILGEDEDWD